MAVKKIAISIPEDVLDQVDQAAEDRGETRSGFIARLLRRAAAARSDAELRRRIDELFADPSVKKEQRAVSRAAAASLGRVAEKW